VPELWDGHAAERIAAHLAQWLARRHAQIAA
jgi:UDP-N-acetylglucosamine 2-epimerase (non-hydrolysing)